MASTEKMFDVKQLAAEIKLGLLPTEKLPSVAQDAMEAGFDGPAVVRMAILEPTDIWMIGESLPAMLSELSGEEISVHDAVQLLAEKRVKRILESGENALSSVSYFQKLYQATWEEGVVAVPGLDGLAYLDDEFYILGEDDASFQDVAKAALEEFDDPVLRAQRATERQERAALFGVRRKATMTDWPYVFDSPGRHRLLRKRIRANFSEWRRLLGLQVIWWLALVWVWKWPPASIGFLLYIPLIAVLGYWTQYRRLKRERRDILLRMRYPEELI